MLEPGLVLPDRWVWDFWHVWDGADCHVFYLQAPKALGDESLRHHNATIGHAVTSDFVDWEVMSDALGPGPPGAWDDLATWTGSVVHDGSGWQMFYTGVSSAEDGLVQRIGRVVSDDLKTWHRVDTWAVLETDERFYETPDHHDWFDVAWRDPWVFKHSDEWWALITARARIGPPERRGVVAAAVSKDLSEWVVGPPVAGPGMYPQMEVPQLVDIAGRSALVFSSALPHLDPEPSGSFVAFGASPVGPFDCSSAMPVEVEAPNRLYSAKLVDVPGRGLCVIGFLNWGADGRFVGSLSKPIPIARWLDG